jgi:hypothetical protein
MSAADLLADLARRGFTLAPEGDGIRVAPASRLTGDLRAAIRGRRAGLLALLRRPATGAAPAGPWDQARADALLAAVNARLDRALAPGGEADTPPRRNVAEVYRRVVANLHQSRDPLLWQAPQAVGMLLARWPRATPAGGNRTCNRVEMKQALLPGF